MLGLGASDFEFGVDPSADPELALVRDSESRGMGVERAGSHESCAELSTCLTLLSLGSACVHGRAEAAAGRRGPESCSCIRC